MALDKISEIKSDYKVDNALILQIQNLINNNNNQTLLKQTLAHILLLDSIRNEKLFDLLPFKSFAVDNVLKNSEYE